MELDPSTLSSNAGYKLLIGCVVPRPIAWVSTQDAKGVRNLAPFSFYMGAAGKPPTIVFSSGLRGMDGGHKTGSGVYKDTLNNILAMGEFVVNTVNESVGEQMNITSSDVAPGVDEFELAGVTPAASVRIRPPRVLEAPISMECHLVQTVPVGEDGHMLVIGRVVYFHIRDDLYDPAVGRIDQERLRPIARMAGHKYTRARDIFEMIRPEKDYVG